MKKLLSKLICGSLLVFGCTAASNASAHVLDGSIEYDGHYYKVFQQTMKWEDAKEFCESMGGHLATAETPEENYFMKDFFMHNYEYNHCWLGASKDNRGMWKWVTGKLITDYYDWANGREPNSNYYLEYRRDDKGQWNAGDKYGRCVFMCEWDSPAFAHESNW